MNKILIVGMMLFFAGNVNAQERTDSTKKQEMVTSKNNPEDDDVEENDDDKIFVKVEYEASFPGGNQGWAQYLMANLNASTPVDHNAKKGSYQVIIRFIVSKDGSISNVEAETTFGHGMEKECIRVIKNGPKWMPAIQNGRPVNAYRRQPITFVVQ